MKYEGRTLMYLVISMFCLVSCHSPSNIVTVQEEKPNDVTGNYRIPPLAKAGEGALIGSTFIYPLDDRPTPQCHASTIAETPAGLVVAFFAGTHESHPDVGIRVSRLVNNKWTRPVEVVNGIINDSLRYPCWNPVLFQLKEKELLLFYKVGPEPQKWWGMLTRSKDNGITWSAPVKLGTDPAVEHLLGPIKNKPVQLSDGTILCPTSIEYPRRGEDQDWRVYFEMSKDEGRSWKVIGPINDGIEFDAIQPSILHYPNGDLQVLCRTRQNVIAESWSKDNGQTWSKMTATSLPNPNSGTDAVTLKDGRQLLVYNHTTKSGAEPKGRNMLNLAISADGKTWKPVMTFENVPIEDGYAYPAIIQSTDGKVHVTYTYNRRSVKYACIDPAKL
jgi:predicted neuraminidase